jgi:hypothetical protein
MVLQHHLDSSPLADQTLAALWRAHARRISGRTIAQCVVLGTLGTIIPISLGRGTFVALMSLIVAAFGSYAAAVQPSFGGRWLQPRGQRITGIAVSAIAVLAALTAGLLVLDAIFGGSIEVMRR